jgi:hypothetical protein
MVYRAHGVTPAQTLFERLRKFYLHEDPLGGTFLRADLLDVIDEYSSQGESGELLEFWLENLVHIASLAKNARLERSAWKDVPISARARAIPHMVDQDTMRYYRWLGTQYSGVGEVVQLGCWMGSSTVCLAEGLVENPRFSGRALQVFDSFTWEPWMRAYAPRSLRGSRALKNGDSFMEMFREYCLPFKKIIKPHRQLLKTENERTLIPALRWNKRPVEIMIYDFGQDYDSIRRAWEIFSPWFIPGKTVVVIQPYGNVRAEMLRRFCREHIDSLRPLHKPSTAAKGFIFLKSKSKRQKETLV